MSTDDWFWDWANEHTARFPRPDWPPLGDVYWQTLRGEFVSSGVRAAEAAEASRRLYLTPPAFIGDHPGALLAHVKAIWAEARAKRPASPADVGRAAEDVSNATWDRAAEEHWQSIGEADRQEALEMVRERVPSLARRPAWLLGLAKGWAYDPSLVAGLPPKRREPLPKGIKPVFKP